MNELDNQFEIQNLYSRIAELITKAISPTGRWWWWESDE
jgi:hypothetical protein